MPVCLGDGVGVTMWMRFHGQMSTHPSHMMHSVWSMWMNCFGLTALEVVGVDLDELVLVGVRHHRRVGVGAGHGAIPSSPAVGRSAGRHLGTGLAWPRLCHKVQRKMISPKYQRAMTTTTMSRIGFVRTVNGKLPAERLRLQEVERAVDDLPLAPTEVRVGVVDPLVGHDAEGDEHDDRRRTSRRASPRPTTRVPFGRRLA